MSNAIMAILGLVLIGFAVTMFLNATPALISQTNTGAGSAFENNSVTVKNAVALSQTFGTLFPFLLLVAGFGLCYKSISGGN